MTYIDELHNEMMSSPGYRAAHQASEPVYQLAGALIGARASAKLTQAQIAERMGTTQSAVARLEGGRSNPSAKTLERYAKATGTRLRISFEPVEAESEDSEVDAVANDADNSATVEFAEGVEAVTVTT